MLMPASAAAATAATAQIKHITLGSMRSPEIEPQQPPSSRLPATRTAKTTRQSTAWTATRAPPPLTAPSTRRRQATGGVFISSSLDFNLMRITMVAVILTSVIFDNTVVYATQRDFLKLQHPTNSITNNDVAAAGAAAEAAEAAEAAAIAALGIDAIDYDVLSDVGQRDDGERVIAASILNITGAELMATMMLNAAARSTALDGNAFTKQSNLRNYANATSRAAMHSAISTATATATATTTTTTTTTATTAAPSQPSTAQAQATTATATAAAGNSNLSLTDAGADADVAAAATIAATLRVTAISSFSSGSLLKGSSSSNNNHNGNSNNSNNNNNDANVNENSKLQNAATAAAAAAANRNAIEENTISIGTTNSGGGGGGGGRNHNHNGPYFDVAASKNVTALLGKTAYLNCRVHNLGNRTALQQVSWVRHRDVHLLTVGRYTYTSDQRFRAIHQPQTDDWILQIKYPQHRDCGIYECQISTTPHMSHYIHLTVVEPTTQIMGAPDLYIESGSTINLTCVIHNSPEPPAYIYWNHNNAIINYDSPRGGVSVVTNKGPTTTSFLLIKSAKPSDSGQYQCNPSNAKSKSVTVHVLNGEFPAAIQRAAPSPSRTPPGHYIWIGICVCSLSSSASWW